MITPVAVFQYKCRRCGKLDEGANTALSNAVGFIIDIECGKLPPGIPQTMHDVHHCKDGGFGVSDFIGARRIKI